MIEFFDDDNFEPDENFFVQLKEVKAPKGKKGVTTEAVQLGSCATACVTILNDDNPGEFSVAALEVSCLENSEFAEVLVKRKSGTSGKVSIPYSTKDLTAAAGTDYVAAPAGSCVVFENGESEKIIKVQLIEDDAYEKSETFVVAIGAPNPPVAGVIMSKDVACNVVIIGDENTAKLVNQVELLVNEMEADTDLSSKTWMSQFDDAMNIHGEEGENPSTMDYIMHFLTFGWKVIFATVPPTSHGGGWVCFTVALCYIGVLTAFVADIASIFGCLIGLPDAVTAITFVALGTSLPDTFASKASATGDEYADNSVGNVTGSNSVNVFLGLGLPWMIATFAQMGYEWDGEEMASGEPWTDTKGTYGMEAGDLGFSVILFCICAVTCIAGLYVRRFLHKNSEGVPCELGGPLKNVYGGFFIGLWILYVVLSSLKATGQSVI